jgi:alkaline phosphatase
MNMKLYISGILVLCALPAFAEQHAKNVILFLGDAGGIPTLSAGSIYGYNDAQKLYIQHMPHVGLSDTSASNTWVTDSAAGMTAIVTGTKTYNGAIAVTPEPPAGKTELAPLKTILEYAEEHGLSTGVVTNMSAADATPAACYAHMDSRKKWGAIFAQVWKPRFGDGVDVVFGSARSRIMAETKELGFDLEKELRASGREFYDDIAGVPVTAKRVVALMDKLEDVNLATSKAVQILSRNPKGYFLMVEWDLHPTDPEKCLKTVVALDKLIERTAKTADPGNTLVLFTADHSFDFRLLNGKRGAKLVFPPKQADEEEKPAKNAIKPATTAEATAKSNFGLGTHHAGEEVLIAAEGPGSEHVHGFMHNTEIFRVLLSAFGWTEDSN